MTEGKGPEIRAGDSVGPAFDNPVEIDGQTYNLSFAFSDLTESERFYRRERAPGARPFEWKYSDVLHRIKPR